MTVESVSDELAQSLMAMADSIVVCDAEGRVRFVNRAFEVRTGCLAVRIAGQLAPVLSSDRMPPEFPQQVWTAIRAGRIFRTEFSATACNGNSYTEEQVITPLLAADGSLTGFICAGRDNSEHLRIRAERNDRIARQETLSGIAQRSVDARDLGLLCAQVARILAEEVGADRVSVYEWSDNGRDLGLLARYGTPGNDTTACVPRWRGDVKPVPGKFHGWIQFRPPATPLEAAVPVSVEARNAVDVLLQSGADAPGLIVAEWFRPHASDARDLQMLSAVGRILGSAVRRLRGEEALRDSEERYRNLFEGANDIIWTCDLEGRFTALNHAGVQLLEYARDEFCGLRLAEVLAPEQRGMAERILQSVRQPGQGHYWQLEFVSRGGRRIGLEASILPWSRGGQLAGMQAIARNVGELRQVERQLQYSQRMEAVGTLAGGIAHEFNNLLTVIAGNTELLMIRPGADAADLRLLRETHRASERAEALVRQLLAFSRHQKPIPTRVNLNRILRDARDVLSRLLTESIRLDVILDEDLHEIRANPGQLEQVIFNLVINARDAIAGTGEILISTSNLMVEPSQPSLWPLEPGRYMLLQISDSGTGIDPAVKDRIFEPFFTTKGVGQGSGLGLSSAWGIVKNCGGTIWVDSQPGRGSCFNVAIPALDPVRCDGPGACLTEGS